MTRDPILNTEIARLRRELRIETSLVWIGVDRFDDTKGIFVRLDARDCLFTRRPAFRT